MNQITMKKTPKIDILAILAFFVVARISCTALSNIPIFTMSFTFIYGTALFILYFALTKNIKKHDLILIILALVYALYIFLRGYAAGDGLFSRSAFRGYIITFLTVVFVWIKDKPLKTKVLFFRLIVACLVFNYVYSIIVLCFDPMASRVSATENPTPSPYDVLNCVGGYDGVYGGISVAMIFMFIGDMLMKKKIINVTTVIILALIVVFTVMASFGTAIVLLIAAFALYFMQKNKFFTILVIACAITLLIYHEQVGEFIMDFSKDIKNSEVLSIKVHDVGYMFKNFKLAGTYAGSDGRFARMEWSWNTFKEYPLFGGIGIRGAKTGGHSELLDMLGKFGLSWFVIFFSYLVCLYTNVRSMLVARQMKNCWNIVIFMFLITLVLSTSMGQLQMMPLILMMSLAPSYIEYCESKKCDRIKKNRRINLG